MLRDRHHYLEAIIQRGGNNLSEIERRFLDGRFTLTWIETFLDGLGLL